MYAHIDIFEIVKRKHGQEIIKITRNLITKDLIIKHHKIKLDINVIKKWKQEDLIPTFATVHLAIKHGTIRLKKKIARMIMDTELQNKHTEKRKLKKKILEATGKLRRKVTVIIYSTILHQINKAVMSTRHTKKINELRRRQQQIRSTQNHSTTYLKHTVCNMSSYELSDKEYTALSFGLDHHIPSKTDANLTYAEFETYYQSIIHKLSNLPETEISYLKTKLRSGCEKYNKIKIPYKESEAINRLSKKPQIIVLRQDKGRGIVIMDKVKYTEKCMKILITKQFCKLQKDPTKSIEMKIQAAVRKIKNKLQKKLHVPNRLITGKVLW